MVARDCKLHHGRALDVRRGHAFVIHDKFWFEQVEVEAHALAEIACVESTSSFAIGRIGTVVSVEVGAVVGCDLSSILKQSAPIPLPCERGGFFSNPREK